MKLGSLFLLLILFSACKKNETHGNGQHDQSAATLNANIPVKPLTGPVDEMKFYQLFPGYSAGDVFEASGLYVLGDYFYVVFDNRYQTGKVLNTMTPACNCNTFTGSNIAGNSNFEGITYNTVSRDFYVITEAAQNGSNYYPQVTQYDTSFNSLATLWTNYPFTYDSGKKGFEGVAYIRRNNTDYLLCLVEGTGKIAVMQLTGNTWTTQTAFSIPAAFSDYSEIALYGNKIAVMSQQDARFWLGTLSDTSWAVTNDTGAIYTFPTGNGAGIAGAGSYNIYSFEEGLAFINDSTIATCSDHADNSDPAYEKYKDQSLQIFKLR